MAREWKEEGVMGVDTVPQRHACSHIPTIMPWITRLMHASPLQQKRPWAIEHLLLLKAQEEVDF